LRAAPRTDPIVRYYRNGLLPWLLATKRTLGWGCTMRAGGSHRSASKGAASNIGKHSQIDRDVGLDDRSQAVLAINEDPVHVERDPLMGDDPFAASHRLSEAAHNRRRDRPVGGVGFQPFRGLLRGHGLELAAQTNPLLKRVNVQPATITAPQPVTRARGAVVDPKPVARRGLEPDPVSRSNGPKKGGRTKAKGQPQMPETTCSRRYSRRYGSAKST